MKQYPCVAVDCNTQLEFWSDDLAAILRLGLGSLSNLHGVGKLESGTKNCTCLCYASSVRRNEDPTSLVRLFLWVSWENRS